MDSAVKFPEKISNLLIDDAKYFEAVHQEFKAEEALLSFDIEFPLSKGSSWKQSSSLKAMFSINAEQKFNGCYIKVFGKTLVY